nr:hypothetical protein [Tanacetum cinerariifolium]
MVSLEVESEKWRRLLLQTLLQMRLSIKRGDSLVRVTTTASSLEAEQDSGNIDKPQTKATSNEPSSQGTSSGDGPRRQDTMGDTSAHTRYERVSKIFDDSLLAGVNTPRSDEDRPKHIKLMKIYTTLQKKVLDLEDELKRTKTSQQTKIDVSAAETIVTTAPTITAEYTRTNVEDKGKRKAKLIEEPKMPKKRKHQIRADKELAKKLQAEMQAEIDEEDRLARERERERESSKGTRSK